MPARQTIHATKRDIFGKKLNSYRSKGQVPANIYSRDIESIAIWFDSKELSSILKDASESTLLDLSLEGESKTRPVILRHVNENMFKPQVIHVDVQQVNLKEKMVINIPIEITGESEIVSNGLGILETPTTEIEIEALPTDLPETISIDISPLTEIGQHILVKDINALKGIEILSDPEAILAVITEPAKEEEEAVASESEAVANVETTSEQKGNSASGQSE